MQLTIKLIKKPLLNGQAEECIRGLKFRTRKCFKIVAGKREHKVWLEFRPVRNQSVLTRIFRPVTGKDERDLLEAILWVLSCHITELQYPGRAKSLAERLWQEEAVRGIWPDLASLAKNLQKEERRLAEFIGSFRAQYEIHFSVTSRRKRTNPKNLQGKSPGEVQINSLKPVLEGKELPPSKEPGGGPQVVYSPVRKPFFGYIHKLGCRPGTASEIVMSDGKMDEPVCLHLDLESKQQVLDNPEFFSKRLLKFTYHPKYEYVVSFQML